MAESGGLSERDLDPSPFTQFASWFAEAQSGRGLPEAMALATATRSAEPSVRMVLLKGFDERGLVFYTNYESRKGRDLAENPRAAALLYWWELGRQVRFSGMVSKISEAESAAYFHSRPLDSQLSALASRQSQVIPSRDMLEARVKALAAEYAGREVPMPAFWGGYRLAPDTFEFWVHRENRLHDRFRYRLTDGRWVIERLSP